jgi:RHS repeat-associated protein
VLVISVPVPLLGPGTARAVSPASVIYYHADALGSSVVLTAETGSPGPLRHVLYRPYGGVVAESAGDPGAAPEVGYTGQRFEAAAGLYDYGARWYDPELGRFLQPDAIVPAPFNPQSLNRYSYVMNDPVNHTDPTGSKFIFTGGSAYGGSIYGTDFGYDVFVGSGTRYSASPRASAPSREDRPAPPMPSAMVAEPFSFAQVVPVQAGRMVSQSGTLISGVARTVQDDLLSTVLGLGENVLGIVEGLGRVFSGAITRNGGEVQGGVEATISAFVPRYGFFSGPAYGLDTLSPRHVIDRATRQHDLAYADLEAQGIGFLSPRRNPADEALIRDIWRSHRLGPVGQVYRVGLTAAFGLKIGAQTLLGRFGVQ